MLLSSCYSQKFYYTLEAFCSASSRLTAKVGKKGLLPSVLQSIHQSEKKYVQVLLLPGKRGCSSLAVGVYIFIKLNCINFY